MPTKTFQLSELNAFLKRLIALNFKDPVWVRGEWAEVKSSRGHVYGTLIEKENDQIIAQSQTVIWSRTLQKLDKKSKIPIQDLLQAGLNVLVQVKVDYHERFGLKLIIEDIDPSFTMGDLEIKRRKTLESLRSKGLLDLNRLKPLTLVPQRIAVISGAQAAGFIDFKSHLEQNPYGYAWKIDLFQSAVQGKNTVKEVRSAFEKITRKQVDYDLVVIIRGGGSRIDLSAFDDGKLCESIAQSPLPVVTGIGHEIDESIADLVAFQAFKTPTAVADFLIDRFMVYESSMIQMTKQIKQLSIQSLAGRTQELNQAQEPLKRKMDHQIQSRQLEVESSSDMIQRSIQQVLQQKNQQINFSDQLFQALNPFRILERGFTITLKEGRILKEKENLPEGTMIETRFQNGSIRSTVKSDSDE